jgi:hypothetical protein
MLSLRLGILSITGSSIANWLGESTDVLRSHVGTRCIQGGVSGWISEIGCGSFSRIAAIKLA